MFTASVYCFAINYVVFLFCSAIALINIFFIIDMLFTAARASIPSKGVLEMA